MNNNSITHKVNLEKEYTAYKTIIEDQCINIDNFLAGRQKELILETLIVALKK